MVSILITSALGITALVCIIGLLNREDRRRNKKWVDKANENVRKIRELEEKRMKSSSFRELF